MNWDSLPLEIVTLILKFRWRLMMKHTYQGWWRADEWWADPDDLMEFGLE